MIDYKLVLTTSGSDQKSEVARFQDALASLEVTVELLFDCTITEDEKILARIDASCLQKLEQMERDLLDLWSVVKGL